MKPWRLQKLASDVVWDLRNRGLLPVVALLAVAIVAVPILILRQARDAPDPDPSAAAEAELAVPETSAAVLAYDPGVRNYRKRLARLQQKDPFVQQFQSASSAAAVSGQVSSGSGASVTPDAGGGGSSGGGTDGGGGQRGSGGEQGGGGGGDGAGKRKVRVRVRVRYLSFRLDARVGELGELRRRRAVQPLSFLPGEKRPVLVFLGIGGDGDRALFLVSSEVTEVRGDGKCVSGDEGCELLVLGPGEAARLDYEPDGSTYAIQVLAIRRVARAPR